MIRVGRIRREWSRNGAHQLLAPADGQAVKAVLYTKTLQS